jgi:hypothetical protein
MGALDWLQVPWDSLRNIRRGIGLKINQFRMRVVLLGGTWEEIDSDGLPGVRHPPWVSWFPPAVVRTALAESGAGVAQNMLATVPAGKAWLVLRYMVTTTVANPATCVVDVEEDTAAEPLELTARLSVVAPTTAVAQQWPNNLVSTLQESPAGQSPPPFGLLLLSSRNARLRFNVALAVAGITTIKLVVLEWNEAALIVNQGTDIVLTASA